jgi:hypothetical protein
MDGFRIPAMNERVFDVSEDGRLAVWGIDWSDKLTVVDLNARKTLGTFDVGMFLDGVSTGSATIIDALFLPGSTSKIAVSVDWDLPEVTAAIVLLDVRDSTYTLTRWGDSDVNGWSPTIGNYVYSNGKVKVDGKVFARVSLGYLYDFASNTFRPPLLLSAFNGRWLVPEVTANSRFVFAYTSKIDSQGETRSYLQVDGKVYDVDQYLYWLEPGYAVEGTDVVVSLVNLERSNAFGGNVLVLDVKKLVETGSYRDAVIKEVILQDLYCKFSFRRFVPRGIDEKHVLVSMHSDGDYIQRAASLDLTNNSFELLSDFP